jgi:hypothetical protein
MPPQLRLRVEMLLLSLADIENQSQRLDFDDTKCLPLTKIEELFPSLNKAHYYLHEVETHIHLELWGKLC